MMTTPRPSPRPSCSQPGCRLQRTPGQDPGQVPLVLSAGVEICGRIGSLRSLLRSARDALRAQRLAAERLLDGGCAKRNRAHVGQADADVLDAVAGVLDDRADGDHRPVLGAAVELLVAESPALERRDPDLCEHLV